MLGTDGTVLANTYASVDTLRNGLTVAAIGERVGPAAVLVGAGEGAFRSALSAGTLGTPSRVGFFDGFDGGVFVD